MTNVLEILCGAMLLARPVAALIWDSDGHQIVAKLAEAQLTPKA